MPETIDSIVSIRGKMLRLGVYQIDLVNKFVDLGLCDNEKRNSLSTQLNFALTGKRTTKRYKEILNQVSEILDEMDR